MALTLLKLRDMLGSRLPRRDDDRGAAMVEYALLVVLIFLVLIIAVNVIGTTTSEGLDDAGSSGFVNPN